MSCAHVRSAAGHATDRMRVRRACSAVQCTCALGIRMQASRQNAVALEKDAARVASRRVLRSGYHERADQALLHVACACCMLLRTSLRPLKPGLEHTDTWHATLVDTWHAIR